LIEIYHAKRTCDSHNFSYCGLLCACEFTFTLREPTTVARGVTVNRECHTKKKRRIQNQNQNPNDPNAKVCHRKSFFAAAWLGKECPGVIAVTCKRIKILRNATDIIDGE
jgi:hypothetical protein